MLHALTERGWVAGDGLSVIALCTDAEAEAAQPMVTNVSLEPRDVSRRAARVALETRCPVIPVAQWGPQEIIGTYEKRVRLFPRKVMHVRAGPPVNLSDLYDVPMSATVLREATERIMAAITRELEVLRGEKAPPVRFDARSKGVPVIGWYRPEGHPQVSLSGREGSTSGEHGSDPMQNIPSQRENLEQTHDQEESR